MKYNILIKAAFKEGLFTIMFSLILIDDEIFQLKALKKLINWEHYGFCLKQAFYNPAEALAYLKENKTDLIITDISMSDVSGLDIAKYLHQTNPAAKVIFLSAYKDFEYARQAITYNVASYLVKPITVDALSEVLSETSMLLNKTYRQSPFKGSTVSSAIRKLFINLLMDDGTDTDLFSKDFSASGIELDLHSVCFASICAAITDPERYHNQKWTHGQEKLIFAIEQLLNTEHYCAWSGLTFFYHTGFDIFLISKKGVSFEQFSHFLSAYQKDLVNVFAECLHMDISLNTELNTNRADELFRYREKFRSKKQVVLGQDKQIIFQKVKQTLEECYMQDITLEGLAAETGFNPTYFSKLFKEHFGMNVVNYLCNLRIEAAKKILVSTNVRITSVFQMVGFSQHSYFVKQFKIYTGLTPTDYRNKYRKM